MIPNAMLSILNSNSPKDISSASALISSSVRSTFLPSTSFVNSFPVTCNNILYNSLLSVLIVVPSSLYSTYGKNVVSFTFSKLSFKLLKDKPFASALISSSVRSTFLPSTSFVNSFPVTCNNILYNSLLSVLIVVPSSLYSTYGKNVVSFTFSKLSFKLLKDKPFASALISSSVRSTFLPSTSFVNSFPVTCNNILYNSLLSVLIVVPSSLYSTYGKNVVSFTFSKLNSKLFKDISSANFFIPLSSSPVKSLPVTCNNILYNSLLSVLIVVPSSLYSMYGKNVVSFTFSKLNSKLFKDISSANFFIPLSSSPVKSLPVTCNNILYNSLLSVLIVVPSSLYSMYGKNVVSFTFSKLNSKLFKDISSANFFIPLSSSPVKSLPVTCNNILYNSLLSVLIVVPSSLYSMYGKNVVNVISSKDKVIISLIVLSPKILSIKLLEPAVFSLAKTSRSSVSSSLPKLSSIRSIASRIGTFDKFA